MRGSDGRYQRIDLLKRGELEKCCQDGMSTYKIASLFGCGPTTVRRRMSEFNIETNLRSVPHPRAVLSHEQEQVLIGALLGDGTINDPKGANSRFKYVSKHEEMINYIGKLFNNLRPASDKRGFLESSQFSKGTGKTHVCYRFSTANNILFSELRSKWYPAPDCKKIVPNDVVLTSLVCLIWYLGDGYLAKGNGTQWIGLATCGFSERDIEFLVDQLSQFRATWRMKKEDKHPIIRIPRIKIEEFLNYVGECPVKCYKYKWEYLPYKLEKFRDGTQKDCAQYKQQIVDLYQGGMNCYKIAKLLNVGDSTVRYHLKKVGVYARDLNEIECMSEECSCSFVPKPNQKYCTIDCRDREVK